MSGWSANGDDALAICRLRLASCVIAASASHALRAGIKGEPRAGGGESISIRNGVMPVDPIDDHVNVASAER
jgi:hypothetical protein